MTGNGRQSHADGAQSDSDHNYKSPHSGVNTKQRTVHSRSLRILSLKRVASYTVGTMVPAWFLAKLFVAFVPLTSVVAQYAIPPVLPKLLDATADELISGLEAGDFTSLDLVQVSNHQTVPLMLSAVR